MTKEQSVDMILNCLENESNEILIPDNVIVKARQAVEKMTKIGR